MRYLRVLGLCLVAVFALSAVVVAGASAGTLPEVMQCGAAAKEKSPGKNYEGHYTGKKCEASTYSATYTTKTKYELEPWNPGSKSAGTGKKGVVKKFKGKSGTAFLEVVGLGPVTCKTGADEGEFTGPKTAGHINVTFKTCELNKIKCSNTSTAGEIKTKSLQGEIGYFDERFENPVTKGVGVKISAESGDLSSEGQLVLAEDVNCGSIKFQVKASVIGEVEPPYNTFTKEVKLKFQQAAGRQAIERFEGEPLPPFNPPTETGPILCTELWGGAGWLGCNQSSQSGEAINKGEELELAT